MSTSAKDRLFSLFPNKNLPPLDPTDFHPSQAALSSQRVPVPIRPTSRSTGDAGPLLAEQDEYVLASTPYSSERPKRRRNRQAIADAHPQGSRFEALAEIKYFPYGKPRFNKVAIENDTSKNCAEPESKNASVTGIFCLFSRVTKFPYEYMDDPDDQVSRQFFAANKIYERLWDLYFVLVPESMGGKAIFLVPLAQVQNLIEEINITFKADVGVPPYPFTLKFFDDDTPQPKMLGQSTSRSEIIDLQASVPICKPSHGECPPQPTPATQKSFAAFHEKCQMALVAMQKRKRAWDKKKNEKRMLAAFEAANQLKRAQRYFGLKPSIKGSDIISSHFTRSDYPTSEQNQTTDVGVIDQSLNLDEPAPYPFECEPIVISIDVEAWEEDHRIITEVGVSTLDTLDLVGIPPGLGCESWINQIRSRHFRIVEYQCYVNQKYCRGNPDGFEFGKTEWVTIKEAASTVDSCFEWPYSVQFKHSATSNTVHQQDGPKHRNLLLLGHDTDTDVAYLSALGSHIFGQSKSAGSTSHQSPDINSVIQHSPSCINEAATYSADTSNSTYRTKRDATLASMLESLDTATLFKSLHNENQPRSLVKICYALGVPARHAHNAGNDARYTLEALIKLVFKARMEGQTQSKRDSQQ